MYRHQQYESRFVENVHHEELPFFRQAVALIDSCTKLLKDDRIFLRNRIKDYLRVLKQNKMGENEEESDQMKQIIQIFIEANKKKSLNKIQKGDKAMDWLQIKLRKFVDNAKKERHRREVQNFRKGKFIDIKKLLQPAKDKNSSQIEHNRNSGYEKTNYHLSTGQNKHVFAHSSLSRSREKDPIQSSRKKSQNNSYAQYSYHNSFGFLKKSKDKVEVPTRDTKPFMQPSRAGYISNNKSKESSQEKSYKLNKSLQANNNLSATAAFGKVLAKANIITNNYLLKQTPKNNPNMQVKPTIQKSSTIEKQDIDRLTKLFSQHLNASSEKISQNNSRLEQEQSISDFGNMQNSKQLEPSLMPLSSNRNNEPSNRNNEPSNNSISRYQESSKKLQEMLDSSKHLFEQFSFNNSLQLKAQQQKEIQLSKKPSQDDLFTPPDFLAECRKFISNSSKKKESLADPFAFDTNQNQLDYGKKLTFSNVLRESRQKMQQKVTELNQMSINEAFSQNVSANISTKKPESEVAFRFKNISINNAEDLLLQIFRKDHKTTLDRYQLGEIMSKCSTEMQKLLQKYCDVLSEQLGNASTLFQLQFVAIVKYFFSYKKILNQEEEHYSNFLCSILDMKQQGYISRENIDQFVESMQGSEVDPQLLDNIRDHLYSIYERCCAIEGGGMLVTRWSLYYLQITHDAQFNALKQQLSNFDFQIDMQDDQQQSGLAQFDS